MSVCVSVLCRISGVSKKKDTVDTDGCGCYGSDDGKMEVKTEKKSEARHKHEPEHKHKTDKNKLVYY